MSKFATQLFLQSKTTFKDTDFTSSKIQEQRRIMRSIIEDVKINDKGDISSLLEKYKQKLI